MSKDNDDFVLPSDVVQAVAIGNLKAIAEQPAMISNLAYADLVANTNLSQQNAVANQQALNDLGMAVTGKSVTNVANLGPLEARSAVDVLTNDELAQTLADLKATVEAFRTNSVPPNPLNPPIIFPTFRSGTSELILIWDDPRITDISQINISDATLASNLIVSFVPTV